MQSIGARIHAPLVDQWKNDDHVDRKIPPLGLEGAGS